MKKIFLISFAVISFSLHAMEDTTSAAPESSVQRVILTTQEQEELIRLDSLSRLKEQFEREKNSSNLGQAAHAQRALVLLASLENKSQK